MSELTYATVCSGIECMSAAAIGLPLRPVFFSEIEPFPCAVLKHRFPHVPNLGDMSRITINEKGEITNGRTTVALPAGGLDILAGGTPCFAGGTMVLTPRGYVPIETIKVGDEVVSGSGHVRKVTAVGNKLAAVGAFRALGRPEIICTPNHPFMCVSVKTDHRRKSETFGRKIAVGDYVETRADESAGKYVGRVNHMRGTAYSVTFPKCYNASVGDMMELAGWYLGDGYIRRFKGKNKKCVMFALCSEKKIAAFRERFGGKVSFTVNKDGKISMSCTAFADWLILHFGEHSDMKRIPFWCYDRETTSRLVEGYVATDGTTQGRMTRFSTVSPALAYGIADILGHASVCKQKTPDTHMIEGRTVRQKDCYVVSWCHSATPRTRFINTRYASIVRSYHGSNGIARVYNITVEGEHTYIANGLYTHNCQDVSNAGKRRGMQEGSGTRSSLAFEFVRLIRELRPRYVMYENVDGILSDESFPTFLRAIADCGYGVAYRTLDAQYVRCADIDLPDGGVVRLERAIPQRRRRVWVVGCAGEDIGRASEILFEPQGVCGDRPPRRVTWQGTAKTSPGRARLSDGVVGRATAIASNIIGRSDRCGGNGIGAKDEVAYTLDTVKPQGVAVASGFDPYEPGGVKTLNIGHAGTLINGSCPGFHSGVVEVYENHAQDCRVKPCGEVAPTLNGKMGTGGNNVPLKSECFVKVSHARGADGLGERWEHGECAGTRNAIEGGDGRSQECVALTNSNGEDVSPTLSRDCRSTGNQIEKNGGYVLERRVLSSGEGESPSHVQKAFSFDSLASNSMKSKNPLSGCRETEVAKTLDTTVPEPSKNQGGIAIVDASVTAISVATKQQSMTATVECGATLEASCHKEPQAVLLPNVASMRYIVRRLTPTECERLQGLPDGWTLPAFAPGEITDALVAEFMAIFDTFGAVMAGYAGKNPPKPKTAAWVRTWLERIANPATCPDATRYKACGNGWAANQPRWILLRVLAKEGIDPWNSQP